MTDLLAPALDIPFDEQTEQAVLGSILINPQSFALVSDIVKADDFFLIKHQWLFDAMTRLHASGEPIERITLRNDLTGHDQFNDVGGDIYISELMNAVPSGYYAEAYARATAAKGQARRLIHAAHQIQDLARDETLSIEQRQSDAESAILMTRNRIHSDSMKDAKSLAHEMLNLLNYEQPPTIPLPFTRWNQQLGGLPRGNQSVIAAPSGLGKSFSAINAGIEIANMKLGGRKPRVLIFSVEMITELEFNPRVLSILSGIPEYMVKSAGKYIKHDEKLLNRFTTAIGDFSTLNFWVDDATSITPAYVRSKMMQTQPDLVIVDYLQLMDADQDYRSEHLKYSAIIKSLKEHAKNSHPDPLQKAHIMLISQLSRDGIKTARKKQESGQVKNIGDIAATMEDLKESGDIENHSSSVSILCQDSKMEEKNLIGICTRKNRFGDKWFNGQWKEFPPMLERHPETGKMKDAGKLRIGGQSANTNQFEF